MMKAMCTTSLGRPTSSACKLTLDMHINCLCAQKGICSNFLCDAAPGTEIMMTGEVPWCRGFAAMQRPNVIK